MWWIPQYDLLASNLNPFLAIPPDFLAGRYDAALKRAVFPFSFAIRASEPVALDMVGQRTRPSQIQALLEGFRPWLPKDFGEGVNGPVRLACSDNDMAQQIANYDVRERLLELLEEGKGRLPIHPRPGIFSRCSVTDCLRLHL